MSKNEKKWLELNADNMNLLVRDHQVTFSYKPRFADSDEFERELRRSEMEIKKREFESDWSRERDRRRALQEAEKSRAENEARMRLVRAQQISDAQSRRERYEIDQARKRAQREKEMEAQRVSASEWSDFVKRSVTFREENNNIPQIEHIRWAPMIENQAAAAEEIRKRSGYYWVSQATHALRENKLDKYSFPGTNYEALLLDADTMLIYDTTQKTKVEEKVEEPLWYEEDLVTSQIGWNEPKPNRIVAFFRKLLWPVLAAD